MHVTKEDILTPANAVSVAGAALTIAGAMRMDTLSGVAMIGAGRVLDLVDGPVARRTHTSEFGAAVDGTLDKVAVAALVVQGLRHNITHPGVLIGVGAYHAVNAVANMYTEQRNQKPASSHEGKHAMFAQNLAIGGFVLAHALGGNTAIEYASIATMAVSAPIAAKASYDYIKQALRARKS